MKLPISLLLLAALSHASTPSTKSDSKKENQTSKRELLEGNFGDKKRDVVTNYDSPGSTPGIEYAEDLKELKELKDLKEALSEQSPEHKIFGARIPQISKISDVLTGQGQPPFEVAVANHLYAPVSAYQARLSSSAFEIPAPAASQLAYPKRIAQQPDQQKDIDIHKDNQNSQELPVNKEKPRISYDNLLSVKQPRFRFDNHPRPFAPAFFPQQSRPEDVFRQPPQFVRPVSALFPIYDNLGPNRYQGHILPSQYLQQQQRVYQLIPMDPGYDYVNQEDNRGEKNQVYDENRDELKAKTGKATVQKETQVPQQAYHAHPNGAVSFASFTHNLPPNAQPEAASQPQTSQLQQQNEQTQELSLNPQPSQVHQQNEQTQQISLNPQPSQPLQQNKQIQELSLNPKPSQLQQQNEQIQQLSFDPQSSKLQQNEQIQTQQLSLDPQTHTQQQQQQISTPIQRHLKYPSVFQQYIQQLQNYNPGFPQEMRFEIQPNAQSEPQFITLQQPLRQQPNNLNPLQQQLLYSDPRLPIQGIQFQRLPAFKPLPLSQLVAESVHQPTGAKPVIQNLLTRYETLPQQFGYHDINLSTQNPNHIDQPLAPVSQQRHFMPLPPLEPNNRQSGRSLNPYSRTLPPFFPTATPLKSFPSSTPIVQSVPDQLVASTTIQPTDKDHQEHKEHKIHTSRQIQTQKYETLEPEITHQSLPTTIQHQHFATYDVQSNHLQHATPLPQYQSTIHVPLSQPNQNEAFTQSSPRHEVIIQKQEIQELILEPSSAPIYQPQLHRQQQEQEVYQLQSQQNPHEFEQLQPQHYHQLELNELPTQQQRQFEARNLQFPEIQVVAQQQYHNQPLLVLQQQQYQPQLQTQQQTQKPEQLEPQQKQEIKPQQYEQQSLSRQDQQQEIQMIELPEPQQSQETQSQEQQQVTKQTEIQQDKQESLTTQEQLHVSSPKPSQEPRKETEDVTEPETQTLPQIESEHQTTTESSEQTENAPTTSAPPTGSEIGVGVTRPVISTVQEMAPSYFAKPQALIIGPEFDSPAGFSSVPDVQYFGKFAPSLFRGGQR